MRDFRKGFVYFFAYFMWVVSLALWAAFIFFSRDVIVGFLSAYYYQDIFERMKAIQFFNQAYPFVLGLVWLVLMLIVEQYFRNGAKTGTLGHRIARVFGPLVLLLFFTTLAQIILIGMVAAPMILWLILLVELLLAGWLMWLARKRLEPGNRQT
jgi:hypothetical protein